MVQFLVDSRIFAVTDCHEFTLPFTWDGAKATVGQGDSKTNPECTPREQQIDGAFAAVLLSADRITGGLPHRPPHDQRTRRRHHPCAAGRAGRLTG